MKQTVDFLKMKKENEKIVMLTAYDYPTGKLAQQANVDMILVGDSLGMVVLGYDSTIPVTIEDMIHHGKAARRGAKDTFIVVDMPFMTYHSTISETLANAKRIFQETNANALKLEGADEVIDHIAALTRAGIPVCAHLGLTPQSAAVLGGYKVQAKEEAQARKLIEDAKKCQEAGAFAIVLECIPRQLAKLVSEAIDIPTIGIGAGVDCDGQVLVFHDLLLFGSERVPKFVQVNGNANELMANGISKYVTEVKSQQFPKIEHTFTMKEEVLTGLYGGN